jgi:PBP1b-binding outer membrane lipoprotein LpoB
MKKLFTVVLIAILTVFLEGCVTLELDEKGFKIGIGIEFPDVPYINDEPVE